MSSTADFQQDRKLVVRILEAKHLAGDNTNVTCDAYTAISLDKREEITPVFFNNNNPFWSEEFSFEDLDSDFKKLVVTVWNKGDDDGKKDEPFGQVIFPRALITSGQLEDEQWFVLSPLDPENSISGDVRLKIAYFPPKENIKTHTFAVNVVAGRDLIPRSKDGTSSNPYLVLHLLPDLRVKSTQLTKVHQDNLNPIFNETFIFVVDEVRNDLELHVSMWHQTDAMQDEFMGHSSIPIGDVKSGYKTDRWYTLLPKPAHIENLQTMLEKRKRMRKSDITTKAKLFALALQTADVTAAVSSKTKKPHKFVDQKLTSLSYCGHCSGIMWALSTQSQCKTCRIICHSKCSKFVSNNCGGMGMIRLKLKFSAIPVLAALRYEKLVSIVSSSEFCLATLLGRVIQEREDAAKTMVKIFDSKGLVVDFLKAVVANEVAVSPDPQTLFRANSMASKAVDVYMKFVGLPYLRQILGPIINNIVTSKKNCEVDPTRLDKKDNLEQNWKNLIGYIQAVVHAIFSNIATFPPTLRSVFHHLQQKVKAKFPNDPVVRYTSVSGFIFLRFFAPAILGPKLFGLMEDYANAKTARTFTLLAKTLQSLSNLAEFGQKEPFMANMNSFIKSKMEAMRNYIDEISTETTVAPDTLSKRKSTLLLMKPQDPIKFERECARMYELFVRSAEKLVEGMKPDEKPSVVKLLEEMADISKLVESATASMPSNNGARVKVSSEAEEATPAQFASSTEDQRQRTKAESMGAVVEQDKSPDIAPAPISNAQSKRPATMHEASVTNLTGEATSTTGTGIDSHALFRSVPLDSRLKSVTMENKAATISPRGSFSKNERPDLNAIMNDLNLSTAKGSHHEARPASPATTSSPKVAKAQRVTMSATLTPAQLRQMMPSSTTEKPVGTPKIEEPTAPVSVTAPSVSAKKSPKDAQKAAALALLQQAMEAATTVSAGFLGKCMQCSGGIASPAELYKFQDKTWHVNHFLCSICDRSLTGEEPVIINNILFCAYHDPNNKRKECAKCETEITGAVLEALGKTWHKDCFTCTACEQALTSNFLLFENMPYCKQDYLKRAGLVCGVCGENIDAEYIEVFGRKYHTACKKCDHCGKLLAGRHFFSLNGSVYCSEHKEEFTNCRVCRQPIDGKVLVALQKQHQYHPEHFNCVSCSKNLANFPFFEREDNPYCQQCWFKVASSKL